MGSWVKKVKGLSKKKKKMIDTDTEQHGDYQREIGVGERRKGGRGDKW